MCRVSPCVVLGECKVIVHSTFSGELAFKNVLAPHAAAAWSQVEFLRNSQKNFSEILGRIFEKF